MTSKTPKRTRKIPSRNPENCEEMTSEQFLKFLLGVDTTEWKLLSINAGLENDVKVSHITLGFIGKPYVCPKCGCERTIHDEKERVWRHANLDDTVCYLHAKIPRCQCPKCGCIEQVDIPWADPYVSYTKRFMEVAIEHMSQMSLTATSRLMMVSWGVLDRIVGIKVTEHLDRMDLSNVKRIRIDETSAKKNHRYITVITDADTNDIIFITKGKDKDVVREFVEWLEKHNGSREQIELVASDFGQAFITGAKEYLPNAKSVLDPFHLVQIANRALDRDRASCQTNGQRMKSLRFAMLKSRRKLNEEETKMLNDFTKDNPGAATSYRLKEMLKDAIDYSAEQIELARKHLMAFVEDAEKNGSDGFKALANTVKKNLEGILLAIGTRINNGYQEGLNGRIQLSKRLARGYHKEMRLARIAYFRDIYKSY